MIKEKEEEKKERKKAQNVVSNSRVSIAVRCNGQTYRSLTGQKSLVCKSSRYSVPCVSPHHHQMACPTTQQRYIIIANGRNRSGAKQAVSVPVGVSKLSPGTIVSV